MQILECCEATLTGCEIWDLYNENRELLERSISEVNTTNETGYHLVVHVIKAILGKIQFWHSTNRPTYPLMWEV